MRNNLYLWLMAALVCGLAMTVASCKDDNDGGKGEGQKTA